MGRVNKFKLKSDKLWVDQGEGFYNNFMQKWLNNHGILSYWTHNESKSVVADSFRTLKGKMYIKKWQLTIVSLISVIWLS